MAITDEQSALRMRWIKRFFASVLGVVVGLVIAELVFSARDADAWPHVNCYIPSDELGVALEPRAHTRVKFRGNEVSEINVNSLGFRGPELGEPSEDEILVIGDSQAFGLGIGEDETIAARLGEALQRPVINAGVPTYGPLEYVAVARQVLETRSPSTIVVVFNSANDFFEHSRPNRERHAVWDGWAVRAETAPHEVTEFPGREFLFRHSHAFFAIRQWLHATDEDVEATRDLGFESEGTLRDLVHEGEDAAALHEDADRLHREEIAAHHARIVGLETAIESTEDQIDEVLEPEVRAASENAPQTDNPDNYAGYQVAAARGHPGDIVGSWDTGESGRDVYVTATLLNRGVRLRRRLEQRVVQREGSENLSALLDHRGQLHQQLETERAHGVEGGHAVSILEPRIRELADLAAEHDVELIVVALPLDVMVDPAEFAKYGREPEDVSGAALLLGDLVETAERLGVRGIDPTESLREAEPGAFLDGDLHLSASGTRAVADAIRVRLSHPAPLRHPAPGLPPGRSAIPSPDEFLHVAEIDVTGSTAAGCATDLVREWLRISCHPHGDARPTGVELSEGGHGEALIVATPVAATLLLPLLPGDELVADFHWQDHTQRLSGAWTEREDAPTLAFAEPTDPVQPVPEEDPAAARLCACHVEVHGWSDCLEDWNANDYQGNRSDCGHLSCEELYGAGSSECFAAYDHDCESLLRCARGDPELLPPCRGDEVNALGAGRCHSLCSEEAPCSDDSECLPWQGTNVCVGREPHGSETVPHEDTVASEHEPIEEHEIEPTETPTIASFAGESCHVETLGAGLGGSSNNRAVSTPAGALVASYAAGVRVRAFDRAGVARGDVVDLELPSANMNGIRTMGLSLVRAGQHNVLGYVRSCPSGYCVHAAVLDDEGGLRGELIGPIEAGVGGQGSMVMAAAGDDVVVAWGTWRTPITVERWTFDEAGVVTRAALGEVATGLPLAIAADAEHHALLYDSRSGDRLWVDEGPAQAFSSRLHRQTVDLRVRAETVEVHWFPGNRHLHVSSELPRAETLPAPVELTVEPPDRLALDRPLVLRLPGRRIHRELDDGLVAARPVRLPAGGALVWGGDRALVFGSRNYAVRCR